MEQLKNNLPIISLGLLIIGTVNLMMFYTYFNIDILSYLDFTEVLQIQFKLFAYSTGLVISTSIYALLNVHAINQIGPFNDRSSRFKRKIDVIDWRLNKWLKSKVTKNNLIIWTTLVFSLSILLSTINAPKMLFVSIGMISIWVFFIFMYYTFYVFKSNSLSNSKNTDEEFIKLMSENIRNARMLILYLCLVYVSAVTARISAYNVLAYSASYEATVVMEKSSFSTNRNYRYIGRTKNFTFFYDMPKKQADVYPNSDIKKMYFREGIRYEDKADKRYYLEFTQGGFREWIRKATQYI